MAQIAQYKVNQFAKDLNLKSKDIIDILESKNISVKSQATLDAAQFSVLFEALTSSNQIVGIEDYIDGITHIPSVKKKSEVEEKKVEEVAIPVEEKPAPAAKEPVSEVKTAIKTEEKQEKKERKLLTDNRMATVTKRETSFEGLVSQLENGEDGIYNLMTENKNMIF